MGENVSDAKAKLRSKILSERSSEVADQTAEQFGNNLLDLCRQLSARTVGVYLSFGTEPATDVFIMKAKASGIELAAPRTGPESTMEFAILEGPTKQSALGFLQPIGEVVEPEQLDLIIAPALSIDQHGSRLGRGGGFFDRYLENYSGPVVAVVYSQELVAKLPVEAHDKPVDYVVTELAIQNLQATR